MINPGWCISTETRNLYGEFNNCQKGMKMNWKTWDTGQWEMDHGAM